MAEQVDRTQDYLLVGGGLQNCLIALLLLHRDPDTRMSLLERGPVLGGNHTWSFHLADVPDGCQEALAPAIQYTWEAYDVLFPALRRTVRCGYGTILSDHLHKLLVEHFAAAPNAHLMLNTPVNAVKANQVRLEDGAVLYGRTVIDARGVRASDVESGAGYQKFVGLELELERPGPYFHPVLMDARVPQIGGFRFFYVLPFSPKRVLVEDTRFSDEPSLDVEGLRRAVLDYAKEKGLAVKDVVRMESGVLPMPYATKRDWPSMAPLQAGYAGGFLHPATGYSFPVALRLAQLIADKAPAPPTDSEWANFLRKHQQQYRFASFLNRLLFTAYAPEQRFHIFQRFYHLSEPVIERFYRLEMTGRDRARIFLGRPPRGFSFRRLLEGAPKS